MHPSDPNSSDYYVAQAFFMLFVKLCLCAMLILFVCFIIGYLRTKGRYIISVFAGIATGVLILYLGYKNITEPCCISLLLLYIWPNLCYISAKLGYKLKTYKLNKQQSNRYQ